MIINKGFTENLNSTPTKLTVIAYNTNITSFFLVDDPMEMTGWFIYKIYLIYSSSVAWLNWLVCVCTFKKSKIAISANFVGALFRFGVKPSLIIKFSFRASLSYSSLLFQYTLIILESRLWWALHIPFGRSFQQNLQKWPFQHFFDKNGKNGHFGIFCHISKSPKIPCKPPETLFFSHLLCIFLRFRPPNCNFYTSKMRLCTSQNAFFYQT